MSFCCICTTLFYVGISGIVFLIILVALLKKITNPYPETFRSRKESQFFDPVTNKNTKFGSIDDEFSIHLSVVVPAYQEESRLPSMLDECLEFLERRLKARGDFKYEIIIVNDGSKDETSKVALRYSQKYGTDKVRLLELEQNRGKGGAVFMGVSSARGAVMLFADADGATKFDDLVKLESALNLLLKCDYLENPDAVSKSDAIICGSRAHLEKKAIATRSAFRNFLMFGFHFLVWFFTVRSIRDTQCGFKLFTRKAARTCFKSLHVNRWAFDVELLFIAERLDIPTTEISVRWTEIEGSKLIPVLSWLQMGKDLIMIWLKYKIGAWKLLSQE